ncbi:MAG TPA: BamA/TamA family outer membrane protein [Polyangiaceae bacterium]|nr:BamA/TamA family outer membrane protein [Polyangiaceae bacterium]
MRMTATARLTPIGLVGSAVVCACTGCASVPPGRSAVDGIDFEGVRSVSSSDLEAKMATTPSPKFLGLAQGFVYDYELFDPFVFQRDLERIERYYRAQGYYEARARAGRVLEVYDRHVQLEVVVEEGRPVLVGDVRVNGIDALPDALRRTVERAVASSGLTRGRRFEETPFSAAEWRVQRALEDEGYAFARVERHAEVDLPHHTAAVTFDVTPDEPATFGPITVRGLGQLPEDPVRRALDIRQGQRFSASALDSAQQALLDLGVFSSAAVTPVRADPPPADRVVPIVVDVSPTRLRTVRLGGGLELDVIKTDLHALAGWTNQNFLGGMRRFDVDFRPGAVLYPTRLPELQQPREVLPEERFRVSLQQPGFIEARTQGYLHGAFNIYPLLITPNVDPQAPVVGYREALGAAGVSRTFWKLYADLSYNVQYNSPFAYLNETPQVAALQPAFITYVDLRTTFDLRDSKLHPHEGFLLGDELQIAGGVLPGEAQDIRVQPQVRAYVPIGHATFATRATTGLLFPTSYSSVPPPGVMWGTPEYDAWAARDQQLVYFRGFFSGGPSSNRGYPVYGVGPHGLVPFLTPSIATRQVQTECVPNTPTFDPARCVQPLGGLTMWELSGELRVPITAQFEEATFCDASDVESGEATYVFGRPHLSCGVGLRYETPVGPIRLDVAYRIPALNPQPGDVDYPGDILGLPIGVAFGIGEAY